MNETDKLTLCRGCSNDYYNHGNHSDTGRCWLLARAKPVERTKVGVWQNPPLPLGAPDDAQLPHAAG